LYYINLRKLYVANTYFTNHIHSPQRQARTTFSLFASGDRYTLWRKILTLCASANS